jgi:glycosyltransferase involved in cell wall biosynthesis
MTQISRAQRIKIAVDLTPLLPGGATGGVKPAIVEFIRALQRTNDPPFDFIFFAAAGTYSEIEAIAGDRDEVINLDSQRRPGTLRSSFFRSKRVDLLYAPFGMVRFADCGVPIVSMVVDVLHRDYPYSLSEREREWRESYFAKMVLYADRLQVISEHTGERLAHHYNVPAEKIFRTYLPIQDRLKIAHDGGRPVNRFFFYPANFWPHKNHEVLLIAYQIYRNRVGAAAWDLVLTGSDARREQSLRELTISLGIAGHVTFSGHLPDQQLARMLSNASALVFPSLHEGFGIPPLEAMKVGVPVLSSDAGSLPEVVGNAGLLVDPRKPIDLAAAMERLASSEELQADLRRRGFERAGSFSFDTEVIRLAETLVRTVLFAKTRKWHERLGRRFALLRIDNANLPRSAAGKVYRFFRDRV